MRELDKAEALFLTIFFALLIASLVIGRPIWAFAAEGHGGGSDGGKLWDLVWRIINFLILAGFLVYLLRIPFKNFLNQRQQSIKESLEKAEEARQEAGKRAGEIDQKLAKASKEIEEIVKMLADQGDIEKKKILENARQEAERLKQQARFMADQEVKKARVMLRKEAVDLAANMAEALLKEKITDSDHKRLVEEYVEKVVKTD
jgi:F-type H+-transporting ATPase subunit b